MVETPPLPVARKGTSAWPAYKALVALYSAYHDSLALLPTAHTTGDYKALWGRVIFDWQTLQCFVEEEVKDTPGVWRSAQDHVIVDGEIVAAPVSDYPELTATVTPIPPAAGGRGDRAQVMVGAESVAVDDPPCQRQSWHINPHPMTNSRAVEMCQSCPVLRDCARAGLMAGTSLDGSFTRPANDVVQAGVICRGDKDTARALAEIAGMDAPNYRDHKPRFTAPDHCVGCGMSMVTRDRTGGPPPAGVVEHMARGKCTDCYMTRGSRGHSTAQVAA